METFVRRFERQGMGMAGGLNFVASAMFAENFAVGGDGRIFAHPAEASGGRAGTGSAGRVGSTRPGLEASTKLERSA